MSPFFLATFLYFLYNKNLSINVGKRNQTVPLFIKFGVSVVEKRSNGRDSLFADVFHLGDLRCPLL